MTFVSEVPVRRRASQLSMPIGAAAEPSDCMIMTDLTCFREGYLVASSRGAFGFSAAVLLLQESKNKVVFSGGVCPTNGRENKTDEECEKLLKDLLLDDQWSITAWEDLTEQERDQWLKDVNSCTQSLILDEERPDWEGQLATSSYPPRMAGEPGKTWPTMRFSRILTVQRLSPARLDANRSAATGCRAGREVPHRADWWRRERSRSAIETVRSRALHYPLIKWLIDVGGLPSSLRCPPNRGQVDMEQASDGDLRTAHKRSAVGPRPCSGTDRSRDLDVEYPRLAG